MKLYILNGPNLNLLGVREPQHYGSKTYDGLVSGIEAHCAARGVTAVCLQSNHEGQLVDWIQEAFFEGADGIVINPGAYTHTSIALLDAVKSVRLPTVEVHISKLEEREDFRQISYIRAACIASVIGQGTDGYCEAVDILLSHLGKEGGAPCK